MSFDTDKWKKNNATPWHTAKWIKLVYDEALSAYRSNRLPDSLMELREACRKAELEDLCDQ